MKKILYFWLLLFSTDANSTIINWDKASVYCRQTPVSSDMSIFLDTIEDKEDIDFAFQLPVSDTLIKYYLFPEPSYPPMGFFFKQEGTRYSILYLSDILRNVVLSSEKDNIKVEQLLKLAEICEYNVALRWNNSPEFYYDGVTWNQLFKGNKLPVIHLCREINLCRETYLPKEKTDLIYSWMKLTYGEIVRNSVYLINSEGLQIWLIVVADQGKISLGLLFSYNTEDIIFCLDRIDPQNFTHCFESDAILVEITRRIIINTTLSNTQKMQIMSTILNCCYPYTP